MNIEVTPTFNINEVLYALVKTLPKEWTQIERDKFMEIFKSNINYIIPVKEK